MSGEYHLQRLKNKIVEKINATLELKERNPELYEYLRSMQVLDGFSMVDKRYNELLKEWKNDENVRRYGKLILEKGYDEALKEFLRENRSDFPEEWEKKFRYFVKEVKEDIFLGKWSIKSKKSLENYASSAISGEYIKKDEEIYGRWGLRFLFEFLISPFYPTVEYDQYNQNKLFKKWYDAVAYAQMIESKEKGGKLKEIMRKILRKGPFKYGDLFSLKTKDLKIQAYVETFKNMKRKGGNNLLVFIREENKEKEKMKLLDMVVDKMIRDHIDYEVDERIKEAYYAVFERAVFGKGDKSKIRQLLKVCNDDENVLRYAIIEALKRRDVINFSNFDDFLGGIENIIYNIQRSQVQREGS